LGIRALLTLLLTALLSADAVPDPELLSQSRYIDVVSVQDAPEYIVYLKDLPKQENYLPTPLERVVFKPRWKFYPHKASGQLVAVAELSADQQWFNAAIYNTLSLEGSCEGCQVALADKILFSKQDNYIIGDFQKEIDLDPLREKIDLRHLKYFVVLLKHKEALQLPAITFKNRFVPKNKAVPMRSVWVWNSQDLDTKLLHKHHIARVYLQLDKGFEQRAKALHEEGFEVYGLDGDPNDIFDAKRLERSLERVIRLNTSEQIVSGFQIDVEPHVLNDFDIDQAHHLDAFVRLVTTLSKQSHHKKLAFSLVTPFWYDTLTYKRRPLIYTLIDLTDETVLMSYRSDPNSVVRISADELAYASFRHKAVQIGVELMPIPDETHKLFALGAHAPCIIDQQLRQECLMLRPKTTYSVKGSTLSFYRQPKQLERLLRTPIVYPAFQGFVFHHMRGLH